VKRTHAVQKMAGRETQERERETQRVHREAQCAESQQVAGKGERKKDQEKTPSRKRKKKKKEGSRSRNLGSSECNLSRKEQREKVYAVQKEKCSERCSETYE